jgi:sugar phosphate isomerase/epimerase
MTRRLGLDTFSLRHQGLDAFGFIDEAARLGLDVVQYSTRENLASHDVGYLDEVRAHATGQGIDLEIGMGSIDKHAQSFAPRWGDAATQLTDMLHAGARLGSPFVRCFLGAQVDRGGPVPFADHVDACAEAITAVAPLARDLGMTIAVENHGFGDFLADELRAFVERVGPDVCAVTLDTGNPTFAAEDPARVADVVAPYVVTTHFRDTAVWPDPAGARGQWVVLGRGTVDLRAILATLDAHAPAAAINIETITGISPRVIPFDDHGTAGDEFRALYPDRAATDLDPFRALVRRGGDLGIGPLDQWVGFPGPETPPEIVAKLRHQQRVHLEGSVAYAQDVLGLGRKRAG